MLLLFYALMFLLIAGQYFFFYYQLIIINRKKTAQTRPHIDINDVTILICVRNEYTNVQSNLPKLLNLSANITVIDDNSDDDTFPLLQQLVNENSNLKIWRKEFKRYTGKKEAFLFGISKITTPFILCTDIDCLPKDNSWVNEMLKEVRPSTEIVLGYSPYIQKPGLLNKFIQYETLITGVQYMSFALAGMPYMGVGRNMLIKRSLFEHINPYENNMDIPSGDDDILVNKFGTASNTRVTLDPKSFVYSEPKSTWTSYFRQKRRHLSSSFVYKKSHVFLLSLFSALLVLSNLLPLVGFFISVKATIIFLVLKWALMYGLMVPIADVFKSPLKLFELIFMEFLFAIYLVLFLPIILFSKKISWK